MEVLGTVIQSTEARGDRVGVVMVAVVVTTIVVVAVAVAVAIATPVVG